MRLLLLLLVLFNLALFGWLRGMFGTVPVIGREPGRLDQQIAAERIRVLTDREVQQLRRRAGESSPAAAPAAAPVAVAPAPAPVAVAPAPALAREALAPCLEIGDFTADGPLNRLRAKLTEFKLADHASEQTQEVPGWYLVYLPPARTRGDVERRAEELRAQDVRDVLVVLGEGPMHFAILLGSFRDRELALKHLAQLERRGVKGARVTDNPTGAQATRVRVRGLDAAAALQVQALQKDFPQQKMQACGPDAMP
jgi:hypothetical protein